MAYRVKGDMKYILMDSFLPELDAISRIMDIKHMLILKQNLPKLE